jgi:hypothetical protein
MPRPATRPFYGCSPPCWCSASRPDHRRDLLPAMAAANASVAIGLLPYPVLLAAQACVLALMFAISADFSHGSGFFVQPHTHAGAVAVWFSVAYASGMVFRYINRMTRRADQRWLGGTIPIVFHTFVAAFLWTFGRYHTQ